MCWTKTSLISTCLRSCRLAAALCVLAACGFGCPSREPQKDVKNFAAQPGDGRIVLTWSNPANRDFEVVRVQRSAGTHPSLPTEGISVYEGVAETVTDTGLENGVLYCYTVFARNTSGVYSNGIQAAGMPVSSSADPIVLETFGYLEEVLDELQGGLLTADQSGEFSRILGRALRAYRGGAPCEAADWLRQSLDLAQDVREGSNRIDTREAAELLYNTGRNIRYHVLSGSSDAPCPGAERFGQAAEVELDEGTADSTRADTRVRFGEPRFLSLWEEGELYTWVLVPEADAQVEEGCPGVPMTRTLLAVPMGASVEVSSTPVEAETVRVRLQPAQNPKVIPPEEKDPSDLQPFARNDAVYALDAPYPATPARIVELGDYRGLRLVVLEVAGGQYNPVQELLTLFSEVNVHVAFRGGAGAFLTDAASSPFEDAGGIYHAALNRKAVWENIQSLVPSYEWLGEELLILTHPSFRGPADTLAAWKNQTGTMTRVFEVGAGTDRETADSIREFVWERYIGGAIRPSYVLLIGDVEYIPTFHTERLAHVEPGIAEYIATDMPYGIMALLPDALDRVPDLAVARIPLDTSALVLRVVEKIIAYESSPPDDSAFYRRAAIVAQFQCCRHNVDWIDRGTNQMCFLKPAEFAHKVITDAGYGVDRIYIETVDKGNPNADPPRPAYTDDPTPRKFWDLDPLPAAIGPDSGFNWDQGVDEILEAWGEGRFLFIHSDHGWPSGWVHPAFDGGYLYLLPRNNRLPFVFSMNCASGYYDNEVDRPNDPLNMQYFVDRLLLTDKAGSIAVIGASRDSGTYENMVLLKGFVDAPFPTALAFGGTRPVRRLGDILNHGRLYMMTQIGTHPWLNSSTAADEAQLYNAFGDPTLAMWVDSPHNLELPAPEEILVEQFEFVVPYPVEETILTAWQNLPDQGMAPIGRGVVREGRAVIPFLSGYSDTQPVMLAASHPEAISKSFTFESGGRKQLRRLADTLP